ncbi:MAG: hypothetical protein NVS4B7_05460 [Ktedonobacteraceae bacterium]
MSSRILYRWSGGTLIVSSILLIIEIVVSNVMCPGHNCTSQQEMSLPWLLVSLTWLIGSLLFLIGFPGMYLRQSERAGVLGFVGFILVFFAVLLGEAAFSLLQIIVLPYLAQHAPQLAGPNSGPPALFVLFIVPPLMITIGSILLGIATMRARMFPRLAGILLLVSGIIFLLTIPPLPSPLGDILEVAAFVASDVAFLWCGYILMAGERVVVETVPFAAEAQTSR